MNFGKLLNNKILLLIIISLSYLIYAAIFLKPWHYQHFSLVDDGQVLIQSSSYLEECIFQKKCEKFIDQTFELGSTRFRPSYWLINNSLFEIFKENATFHHTFRIYLIGLTIVILLALILLDLKVSPLLVFLGTLIFATNYSFSENIIRLGTNEPFQVIFLAIFSLLYIKHLQEKKARKVVTYLLMILLIWTLFIKENNIAILPAIFATEFIISKKLFSKKIILFVYSPFLFLVLGIFVSKALPSSISPDIPVYASNYEFNPLTISENAVSNVKLLLNSLSPFLKIMFLFTPLLLFARRAGVSLKGFKYYYWIIFTISFTLILFPWRYVLERYQLVAIFGLTILIIIFLDRVFSLVKNNFFPGFKARFIPDILFWSIGFFILANLFFRGFPTNLAKSINYREWYSEFIRFEAEQVSAIAKYNNRKVYINGQDNINNWELLYEVPIHLKYLYKVEPNFEILPPSPPKIGFVFSRNAFDTQLSINELSKLGHELVDSKSYKIDQIDLIKFRNSFSHRPLRTILNPPLSGTGIEYYWEIRQLKK